MRIADTKNIDTSNAYCGIGPARYHACLRVEFRSKILFITVVYRRNRNVEKNLRLRDDGSNGANYSIPLRRYRGRPVYGEVNIASRSVPHSASKLCVETERKAYQKKIRIARKRVLSDLLSRLYIYTYSRWPKIIYLATNNVYIDVGT